MADLDALLRHLFLQQPSSSVRIAELCECGQESKPRFGTERMLLLNKPVIELSGAGKSTLLSALLGRATLREGYVRIKKGLRVGYLEQTAVSGTNTTVTFDVFRFISIESVPFSQKVYLLHKRCAKRLRAEWTGYRSKSTLRFVPTLGNAYLFTFFCAVVTW